MDNRWIVVAVVVLVVVVVAAVVLARQRRRRQLQEQFGPEYRRAVRKLFAQERSNLEQQWSRGEDVSTGDLRVALKRYRSFFDRLLTV